MDQYKNVAANRVADSQKENSTPSNENPLEKIDCKSIRMRYTSSTVVPLDAGEEFKSGMLKLCELLQIPTKSNDPTAVLRVSLLGFPCCSSFDRSPGGQQSDHNETIQRSIGEESN